MVPGGGDRRSSSQLALATIGCSACPARRGLITLVTLRRDVKKEEVCGVIEPLGLRGGGDQVGAADGSNAQADRTAL